MSQFLQGQRKALFLNKQNISEFFLFYGQSVSCAFMDKGGANLR